jgi:hypothetical protein
VGRSTAFRIAWPAAVSAAACLIFAGARLAAHDGDPAALAEPGTRFSELDPNGSEGYDGQFTYTMAVIPDPLAAAAHLDRPAYRYQRILYPLAARFLALGDPRAVPWSLLALGTLAAAAATAALAAWMLDHGHWEGYALGLGLWVGMVASPGLFLHEAVAYALVAAGWLAGHRGRPRWGALALSLALFAKEATIPFVVAAFLTRTQKPDEDRIFRRGLVIGAAAFVLWQLWLWWTFGEPGIGSGGAMSTPFEIIPLMGFARIGSVSLSALGLYLVIFGPSILFPAVWGLWASARRLRDRESRAEAWSLLLNAGVILLVPFSTAREPLGLVRLSTGLVLAVLLFAAAYSLRRALNYSLFWTAMLALLLRS